MNRGLNRTRLFNVFAELEVTNIDEGCSSAGMLPDILSDESVTIPVK